MNEDYTIVYIGGPWDMHKTKMKTHPGAVISVPHFESRFVASNGYAELNHHEYRTTKVDHNLFVAVHKGYL